MVPTFRAHASMADGSGWQVVHSKGGEYSVIQAGLSEDAARRLAGKLEEVAGSGQENAGLRERSGEVAIMGDRLASFLYDLLRDHLPAGEVERLVREADPDVQYTNGWLAEYARDLSRRLRG